MGPDRGMLQSAAIGAGRNPRFGGGVAIVLIDFPGSARVSPISRDKPQKTKEFKESGDVTPPALFLLHPPPLSLWHLTCGPLWHEKPSQSQVFSGPRETLRKPSRIAVNRDPFRDLRPGQALERRRPFHRSTESSIPGQKFPVFKGHRFVNRLDFLLHRQSFRRLPRVRRLCL